MKIEASKINEMSFQDVCDVVKDMSRTQFDDFMRVAELACKRKKPTEVQQVANWMEKHLQKFMEIQLTANDTIKYLQTCTVLDEDSIPEWFWETKFNSWNCLTQTFDVYTLKELLYTRAALDFSLILCGPGQVNKSMMSEVLAKLHTIMRKKDYFIFAGKLDSYGPLTLKGLVANAGCCVFDDCAPKSGPGGGTFQISIGTE